MLNDQVSTTGLKPVRLESGFRKAMNEIALDKKTLIASLDWIAEELEISYEVVESFAAEEVGQEKKLLLLSLLNSNFILDTYCITEKIYIELKNCKIETELAVASDLAKIAVLKGHPVRVEFKSGHPVITFEGPDRYDGGSEMKNKSPATA